MIANRAMRRLLDAAGPSPGTELPSELASLLSDVASVDGCFFFRPFAPERVPEGFGRLQDATGYECGLNSFHIEDYLPQDASRAPTHLALTVVAAAHYLAERLRSIPASGQRFRIIGSLDGKPRSSASMRFDRMNRGLLPT